MRYEWKKLFANPLVVLLLLAVLAINPYLFYQHCTADMNGYTLSDVKEKYAQQIDLHAELASLDEQIWAVVDSRDDSLVTGDIYTERRLDWEVIRQQEEVTDYVDFLREKYTEIHARLDTGFMGAEEDFPYQAQLAVAEAYQALEGLQPIPSFSGGLSVFTDWFVTDLLLLVFSATAGLFLLTQERSSGLLLLLRPTAKGHGRLYVRKFFTMLCFISTGFVLLYGENLLISGVLLGFGDLSRPIQSVIGFLPCPVPLTVLGYLICFLAEKLLWLWAVSAVCFMLCSAATQSTSALLYGALATLTAILLGSSQGLWSRCFSLVAQCDVAGRYQDCLMMNLFGSPLPRRVVFPVFCALLTLGSCFGGLLLFCRGATLPVSRKRKTRWLRPGRHCSLGRHEGYKLFITHGALLLLLLFAALQYGIYSSRPLPVSQHEFYLRQYGTALSGLPSPEKDRFLQEEAAHFETLQSQIDDYYSNLDDPSLAHLLTADLKEQQLPQTAFETAKAIYEGLGTGEAYIHPSGYDRLYGSTGRKHDLKDLALGFLFLVLSLGRLFSYEEESGVALLQQTVGAKQKIFRRKLLWSALLTLLLCTLAFLPRLVQVYQTYGLEQFSAQACSLRVFHGLSEGWRVWQILALTAMIRLLCFGGGCALTLFVSRKLKNSTASMLISASLLVLPPILASMLL